MKAVRIQVLAIYAVSFVLGRSAFGQQGEAERLIAQGDKLAWLKNWQAAVKWTPLSSPKFGLDKL